MAPLPDLSSLPCFLNFTTVVVNSILSHTTPIFYPLLSLYLIIWPPTSSLLSRSKSQYFPAPNKSLIFPPPFIKNGYLGEIWQLTLYISKGSPISSLQVGTLNTIKYTSAVLIHFTLPLQLITHKSRWELWKPVHPLEEETHQQRNHQQITTEEGEGGSGSHTDSTQHLSGNTIKQWRNYPEQTVEQEWHRSLKTLYNRRISFNTACPQLHNWIQDVVDRVTLS